MPLAEAQGQWIADYLKGEYALPPRPALLQDIEDETAAMRKRYVASKRHTIQVDFDDYLHALAQGAPRRAPSARAGRASGCPWRRGSRAGPGAGMTAAAARQARAHEGGQPRGDPRRRAARVQRHRLRRRVGARRRARDRPGHRHLLQLLPRQGVGAARAGGRDHRRGPRARARGADGRDDARGLRGRRLSRLLRVPGRGSRHGRAHAPQLGDHPHDVRRARPGRGHRRSCAPTSRRPSRRAGSRRTTPISWRWRWWAPGSRSACTWSSAIRPTWSARWRFVTDVFLGAFERIG